MVMSVDGLSVTRSNKGKVECENSFWNVTYASISTNVRMRMELGV